MNDARWGQPHDEDWRGDASLGSSDATRQRVSARERAGMPMLLKEAAMPQGRGAMPEACMPMLHEEAAMRYKWMAQREAGEWLQ